MKKYFIFCLFILLNVVGQAQEDAFNQNQFLARMEIIINYIKSDTVTASFLFDGDTSKFCFNLDTTSSYSNLKTTNVDKRIFSFLIDSNKAKTKKEKYYWLLNFEKERLNNYKPKCIDKYIHDSISNENCQHSLRYDVLNNDIYLILYTPNISNQRQISYEFIFNNKNEILYVERYKIRS